MGNGGVGTEVDTGHVDRVVDERDLQRREKLDDADDQQDPQRSADTKMPRTTSGHTT